MVSLKPRPIYSGKETMVVTTQENGRASGGGSTFRRKVLSSCSQSNPDSLVKTVHQSPLRVNLEVSVIKSRGNKWSGNTARVGEKCIHGLDGESWKKENTWRPRHRRQDSINLLKPTGYVMHQQFNIQHFTFCSHCIYVFSIYPRTNNDLCHLYHKLIGFYNRGEKCLLRGRNWVFK